MGRRKKGEEEKVGRRKGWGGEARMNDKNSIGEEKGKDKRRGKIQSTEVKGWQVPYWISCCLKNGTSGKVRVMS